MIDSIIAALTFGTVYVSYRAARSAERSAKIAEQVVEHTEKQTRALLAEHNRNVNPKLLPLGIEINSQIKSIRNNLLYHYLELKDDDMLDLSYEIKNVGLGNAYYIESWMEVDNLSDVRKDLVPRDNYNISGILEPYILILENDKLIVREKQDKFTSRSVYTLKNGAVPYDSLQGQEIYKIYLTPFIRTLLIDKLISRLGKPGSENKTDYIISLYIRFKTDAQLETNLYSESKYEVNLHSGYFKQGEQFLRFGINFKPIYTSQIKKAPLA